MVGFFQKRDLGCGNALNSVTAFLETYSLQKNGSHLKK